MQDNAKYDLSPAQEDFLIDLLCAAYYKINTNYKPSDARKCIRYCEQHLMGFLSYLDIDSDALTDIIKDANQQYTNLALGKEHNK